MNKDIRLLVSISDICIGYTCVTLLMCAIGGIAYKVGQTKAKVDIVNILNDHVKAIESK